jgi:hypothetical protein
LIATNDPDFLHFKKILEIIEIIEKIEKELEKSIKNN